jgi:hypothetical protein
MVGWTLLGKSMQWCSLCRLKKDWNRFELGGKAFSHRSERSQRRREDRWDSFVGREDVLFRALCWCLRSMSAYMYLETEKLTEREGRGRRSFGSFQ